MRESIDASKLTTLAARQTETSRLPVIAMAVALMVAPATFAQKSKQLQKRENYEFTFDLPRYVEQLKKELTYPLAWENAGIADFGEWRDKARSKVFECMMAPPRKVSAYDMEIVAQEKRNGYTAQKILFNVNGYSRTTAYMLIPDGNGPFPAVNVLHDHGGHLFIGKEKMIRPFAADTAVVNDADRWAQRLYGGRFLGDHLAANGYVVFSIDAPMWGERGREEGVDRSKYDIIAGNMMMLGRDLSAFMTYDDISSTDFMATLPYVDPERIACAGCSMGGYRAWMLAALSDNIKAAAAVCWMVTTDVQMSTKDKKREYGGFANCLPGLRQYMDYPHIASLACPKPMLFINGKRDHLFPVDGVEKAFGIMRNTWNSQKAGDKLKTEILDIDHSCGIEVQDEILTFFDSSLKKSKK